MPVYLNVLKHHSSLFVVDLNIMPGIFSPTKVLHFFNAPTDFSEANVHEVRILMELFSLHPVSVWCTSFLF